MFILFPMHKNLKILTANVWVCVYYVIVAVAYSRNFDLEKLPLSLLCVDFGA